MTKISSPTVIFTAFALSFRAAVVDAVDFEKDIQPILKDHCFKCHSGPKAKKKIRYDNVRYFKEVIGDHENAVVIPGNPDGSELLKRASLPPTDTDAMPPPRRGEQLNSAELALVRKWILEGASLEPQPDAPEPSPKVAKLHVWTNLEGKNLEAAFVSSTTTSVKLRKEDGNEFEYPLNMLSRESRELVDDLSQ
jgi:hypothetical protein